MGLDMYLSAKKGKEEIEIGYWRNHNALHGWMENLWEERGYPHKNKEDCSFNCIALQLNVKHLDRLEQDILNNNLPETRGFFFGSDSREDDHYKTHTLQKIEEARQAIKDGKKVFYNSWW
jgi:hypothetical protein